MGWSWRRSVSLGPVRLNFSRSGVGVSAGVRGARISAGPRGTYVHIGAGGFRYSQRIDAPPSPPSRSPRAGVPPRSNWSPPPSAGIVPCEVVEAVDPGQMRASSPDELIEEIREKADKTALVSPTAVAGAALLAVGLVIMADSQGPGMLSSLLVGCGLVALLSLPWVSWWDRQSLTTRIHYEADDLGSNVHEALVRLLEAIQRSHGVWSIRVEDEHGDWKRNAGAGVSVDRRPVGVGWGTPPRLLTNVRVGHLVVSGTTLYFLPDRLLIYGPGGIRAVRYPDLRFEPDSINFIEAESVPRDAVQIGETWRFVNKGGGPDLRFKDNRRLAVMRYGVLLVSSAEGLRLKLHLSKDGLAAGAADLLGVVQGAIEDLESRGVAMGTATGKAGPDGSDPIPLAAPARKAAQLGVSVLEYRWLSALPEWAVPIIWGLVFALPLVAGIFLVARGRSLGTWSFMGAALLLSGCGIPVLAQDRRRSLEAQADEESRERKGQFRELLKEEFRSKKARLVDVESLAIECGVTEEEAESVADELYRRMVDRVVADGVVTPEERRTLQILAGALRLTPERQDRLEAEAASERYREAVRDALADGVVTPEESRMLDEMRANLGVAEAGWHAGDVVPGD